MILEEIKEAVLTFVSLAIICVVSGVIGLCSVYLIWLSEHGSVSLDAALQFAESIGAAVGVVLAFLAFLLFAVSLPLAILCRAFFDKET